MHLRYIVISERVAFKLSAYKTFSNLILSGWVGGCRGWLGYFPSSENFLGPRRRNLVNGPAPYIFILTSPPPLTTTFLLLLFSLNAVFEQLFLIKTTLFLSFPLFIYLSLCLSFLAIYLFIYLLYLVFSPEA